MVHIVYVYNIASIVKNHRLYGEYLKVKKRLAEKQFICWIVGGAVRDICLGKQPVEFDLVTDATTENLKELFPEALLVGEHFGVLKLPLPDGEFFDLSTFREEADYADGRRPSAVHASIPTMDSIRRDFTINALYWDDVRNVLIDYQGGVFDLMTKKIACVGDPVVRFNEDHLRILRLLRFSRQLGFEIEKKTLAAAIGAVAKIKKISGERIWSEFVKIDVFEGWGSAVESPLIWEILENVFEGHELVKCLLPKKANIFLTLCLCFPDQDMSLVLKNRLKISKRELKEYASMQYLMKYKVNEGKDADICVLAYELENDEILKQGFESLYELKQIDPGLYSKTHSLLKEHVDQLIHVNDLLPIIPHSQISTEIRLIRLGQFSKNYKSKVEVLDYLKKKYANVGAKT